VDRNLALSSVRRISLAAAIAFLAIALAIAPGTSTAAKQDISADFGWSPPSPTPGQVVTFTAAANPPAGVVVKSYDWDLNGDGNIDKHGKTVTWSYPAPGSVGVRLLVKGNGNHRGEVIHTVSVQPSGGGGGPASNPPIASFTVTPAVPVVNQPVLFTSTSSDPDGMVTEQVWDLNGDGSYDNGGGATALRTFDSKTITVEPTTITSQKQGPRLLSPFPVVRVAGRITKRGTKVRVMRVNAPIGTQVDVRCTGRSCPFKRQVRTISTVANSRTAAGMRVHRLERLLLPGVRVRVYVTKPGEVGKYAKFRFRAHKAPARTDKCLLPGSLVPADCPAL
jgi:hypothetical protein